MHVKDNLVTLSFESNEIAKTYSKMMWELVSIYQATQHRKLTPEQAGFEFLKEAADNFRDLCENPPVEQ